jgi:serine/threonine-protein kinase HipA
MTDIAPRELVVWFRDRRVGVVAESGANWGFDYEPSWLEANDSFALSPALPLAREGIQDGGSLRPVQWFFDNLLPEDAARELLAKEARIAQADAFGLLAYYGAESAGALTLLPAGVQQEPGGLRSLSDEELSRRIRALPQHSLSEHAPKRMSMAGAQHKLPAVFLDDGLHEPVGAAPSTVILKPDHVRVDDYPHSAANEWFCMSLARAVGLPVPDVFLRYVPETVYGVVRFDREGAWPGVRRRHVLDACQLLSIDRVFKYQQSTPATLARVVSLCRQKARTRIALLRWSLFNALIGNGDAHLKNLSFFADADGIALAPHYDIVSTASYATDGAWDNAVLSMPMGGARRFGELGRDDVIAFGSQIGIPERVTRVHLDELLRAIVPAAAIAVGHIETGESPIKTPGEARQLRLIVSGVLRDTSRQLG